MIQDRPRHRRDRGDDARARAAEDHAIATNDPDAWDVAADAWEVAGDPERADRLRDGGPRESKKRFRQSVRWFTSRGEGRNLAPLHAEAERYARRRGFVTELRNEFERYQDVYGYSPENAEIEESTEFVIVLLQDETGEILESIGFVQHEPDAIRGWAAELAYGQMPEVWRRPKA